MFRRSILACASLFALASGANAANLINEVEPNPLGADSATQLVELLGSPNTDFSGWLLAIESDAGTTLGKIDQAEFLSGTFDSGGLLSFSISDLENPSFTLVLVESFTGTVGTDMDSDDDGILDANPATFGLGAVLDAIGVPDAVSDESRLYGTQLGGTDLTYIGSEPQLVFRDGVSGDLYAVAESGAPPEVFDVLGVMVDPSVFTLDPTISTFAATNPTSVVPIPAAAWLFGSAALGMISVARRRA